MLTLLVPLVDLSRELSVAGKLSIDKNIVEISDSVPIFNPLI